MELETRNKKSCERREQSTLDVSKTPATHAARTHHGTHPTIQAAYVQHRFRFEMGLSPWGPVSPDVLSDSQDPRTRRCNRRKVDC